jgi:hypothetical protein
MKLKISNSRKKLTAGSLFLIFTAHLLLLKAHFLGKPNAPLLVFATQPGGEKQVGLHWVFVKKNRASHFHKGKKTVGLVIW